MGLKERAIKVALKKFEIREAKAKSEVEKEAIRFLKQEFLRKSGSSAQPVAPQRVAPQPVAPQRVAPQTVAPQRVVPKSSISPNAAFAMGDRVYRIIKWVLIVLILATILGGALSLWAYDTPAWGAFVIWLILFLLLLTLLVFLAFKYKLARTYVNTVKTAVIL